MKSITLAFTDTEHITEQLWGLAERSVPTGLYAVLDAARAPRIYSMVIRSQLPFRCLYDGELPRVLAEAAPYVVRLDRRSLFHRELLAQGWGNSWGIFVDTPVSLDVLRRHLRRFLLVQDEAGRKLVFRYYDPRVLRVYLQTCTPAELRTLLGPIRHFYMEGIRPTDLLDFVREPVGKEG